MAEDLSLGRLRREADEARAGLLQTVDRLKEQASPTGMLDRAWQSAQDNPLPAVALALGVGYPLLKFARAIPAPIWLIGAGVFLSSTETGKAASRKASEFGADLSEKAAALAGDVTKAASNRTRAGLAAAREAANAASETVSSGLQAATERVKSAADASVDQAKRVVDAASSAPTSVSANATSALSVAWANAPAKEDVAAVIDRTRAAAAEKLGQNIFLVGAVGAAVGALIASALPPSRVEQEWLGDLSDRAKAQGVEAAAGVAKTALNAAAERAQREGFTPEKAHEVAVDYAGRAGQVMDAALKAAKPRGDDIQNKESSDERRARV